MNPETNRVDAQEELVSQLEWLEVSRDGWEAGVEYQLGEMYATGEYELVADEDRFLMVRRAVVLTNTPSGAEIISSASEGMVVKIWEDPADVAKRLFAKDSAPSYANQRNELGTARYDPIEGCPNIFVATLTMRFECSWVPFDEASTRLAG